MDISIMTDTTLKMSFTDMTDTILIKTGFEVKVYLVTGTICLTIADIMALVRYLKLIPIRLGPVTCHLVPKYT
jgi:hypothetical protein